eukprot:252183_1
MTYRPVLHLGNLSEPISLVPCPTSVRVWDEGGDICCEQLRAGINARLRPLQLPKILSILGFLPLSCTLDSHPMTISRHFVTVRKSKGKTDAGALLSILHSKMSELDKCALILLKSLDKFEWYAILYPDSNCKEENTRSLVFDILKPNQSLEHFKRSNIAA